MILQNQQSIITELTSKELTDKDQENWQILVNNSQFGCFMQTWTWANFKEIEGYKTFRYGLFLNNHLEDLPNYYKSL